MARIVLSGCLVVDAQTSVRQTIESMIQDNSSYVLVENTREEVVGIFTDRDVMKKFFEIRDDVLIGPITALMQSPVQMLPLELMHKAPSLMAKLGIRHVPIFEQSEERRNIVGIVTLKGLAAQNLFTQDFEDSLLSESPVQSAPPAMPHLTEHTSKPEFKIGVVSFEGGLFRSLSTVFAKAEAGQRLIRVTNLGSEASEALDLKGFQALAVDIDGIERSNWAKLLALVNRTENGPLVFLTLNANKHDPGSVKTLHLIERSGWLHVYTKPIDLFSFAGSLKTSLVEHFKAKDETP